MMPLGGARLLAIGSLLLLLGCTMGPGTRAPVSSSGDASGPPAATPSPSAPQPSPSSTSPELSDDEILDLEFTLRPVEPGDYISADEARSIAIEDNDYGPGTVVDAFLYRVTDASSPLVEGPFWIVRFTGPNVRSYSGGPVPAPGEPESPRPLRTLTRMYALIDAVTGEYRFSDWLE